jgi:hypothetical protein
MYKFEYVNESLKQIFSNQDTFWDLELQHELQPVLKQLKETGEPDSNGGANFGCKPGISGIVYELLGKTFKLVYTVSSKLKIVKFYEFHQMSYSIDWQAALNALENDNQGGYSIPQIGDPRKFLKAIDFIYQGIVTPHDLGVAMGSLAKKDKDLARRGYYYSDFLEELGLLKSVKANSKSRCTYNLTLRGELIAKNPDTSTKSRLFAEALLGFPPLQTIITATTRGEKQLTPELIQKVIHQMTKDSCGGTTSPRRAGSLKSLTNWVSRIAGIPICRKGQEGVQLYIPYIYAD